MEGRRGINVCRRIFLFAAVDDQLSSRAFEALLHLLIVERCGRRLPQDRRKWPDRSMPICVCNTTFALLASVSIQLCRQLAGSLQQATPEPGMDPDSTLLFCERVSY